MQALFLKHRFFSSTLQKFLLALILLGGSACSSFNKDKTDSSHNYTSLINEIAHSVESKFHLTLAEEIRIDKLTPPVFHLHFKSDQTLNIDEGRALFYRVVNEISDQLNDPQRNHFDPVKIKQIDCSITFLDSKGDFVPSNFLAYVYILDGHVYYSFYDFDSKKFKKLYNESYEEGFKKVHATQKKTAN